MVKTRCRVPRWAMLLTGVLLPSLRADAAGAAKNFFTNPGFEIGRGGWRMDKARGTEARYAVDEKEAAEGRNSALVTIATADGWGMQFGQPFTAGEKGKTYTFAAFAKSTQGSVEVGLQIERSADPWDRVTAQKFKLTQDWQELHVTFTVEKDFPQGWFAYLSCEQPHVQFRADMFRLYEGSYIPFEQVAQEEIAAAAVHVFDTGAPSASALNGTALAARSGWKEIPEDQLAHDFKGDVVLVNDRVAMALRRGAASAEVYSMGPDQPALRAAIAPVADGAAGGDLKLTSIKLVENNPSAATAEAVFATPKGATLTLRYDVKVGQPVIETTAGAGAAALGVTAPCRFVVLPDFFADDIVVDARELPVAVAELPSDNVMLHLLPDGEAIVMTVVKTSEEDVRVALSGKGSQRMLSSSELRYGKDGKIWVAILAGPAIWHLQEVSSEQAGRVIRLPWKAPFPAGWRTDWRRDENLTDSWEMLIEKPDGTFEKHGLFGDAGTVPANRKRWTTVLGTFPYPCWIDKDGQGCFQPLKHPDVRFKGPAIIYPLSRVPATGLDIFTVVDILRNTLGIGPCEYVLDVEGQQSQYKGRATCAVRDTLDPIYTHKEQKKRRADIEAALVDLMIFIRHIRGRIEGYLAFEHEMLTYLAEQKQAHPELAASLGELEKLTRVMDDKLARRKVQIKTPDEAAQMVEEFRKTVLDYEGEDALARCKRFTAGWVDIGGNQDELVGECRWAVKVLRQKAGLLMATEPRMAEIVKEIRRRSQTVLRNPANHEGARH